MRKISTGVLSRWVILERADYRKLLAVARAAEYAVSVLRLHNWDEIHKLKKAVNALNKKRGK